MKEEHKIIMAGFSLVAAIVGSLIGYNLYTNDQNRKQYAECLRITEKLLEADSHRISTPYCRN